MQYGNLELSVLYVLVSEQ